jgi:hypothetical protein
MSPLNGVLTEAWALYRRYAAHFLLISFVIYLVIGVIVGLLRLAGIAGGIIGDIFNVAALALLMAALIKAVQDVRDGRVDLDLRQTVSAAVPYILSVAVAWLLATIGIAIGLVFVIVPGLILLTFWCLIVPCIVIGGSGIFESFGQSWRTVRGYAWHVFGTLVLVFLLYIAFIIVLGLILVFLPRFLTGFVATVVAGTLVAPFIALVITLIYYRLTAAHANQPYVSTGPGTPTTWEPPYPSSSPTAPPAGSAPPGSGPTDDTDPSTTAPYAQPPRPTTPGPAEPGPTTPPDPGGNAPPPPPSGTP